MPPRFPVRLGGIRLQRGVHYRILDELVWYKNYQAMQFLIDRGIDITIRDYRWDATAEGWARVAAKDEKLGQFLRDAQQRRDQTSH